MERVAAFTDTYLPTVNGVSYTVNTWRDRWHARGGRMDVVYPDAPDYDPAATEHPVRSLPFPFYDGFRVGLPSVPAAVADAEVVHAHTPFGLGVAARRLARRSDRPLVGSYHTPTAEYADYLAVTPALSPPIRRLSQAYERRFFDRCDRVLVPSKVTHEHVRETVGVDTPIQVLPNGVDVEHFRPVDPRDFLERHELTSERPLVGYTGRHGHEKRLVDLVAAAAELDVTLVFGGDGPARPELARSANQAGIDARFLGFLDRGELPAFYAALDVFAFPSPVETQGIVALESIACGTPVVGADRGALVETVEEDKTGYRFPTGDIPAFRAAIDRALAERDRLGEWCLERREEISVEHTMDRLDGIYDSL